MRFGIIGLGLMGSSMALALKNNLDESIIYGSERNEEHLQYCIESKIIDHQLSEDNLSVMDIIFIAVPVRSITRVIGEIEPFLDKKRTLITDMGSTKTYICHEVENRFTDINFIGGHPMTGRELSGPQYALSELFLDMPYILIKKEEKDLNKIKLLEDILCKIGADVIFMEEEIHDQVVALTSHLPHFMASSLVNRLKDSDIDYPELDIIMGQGFRDFTRIAAASPDVWKDIFLTNKKQIYEQINQIIAQMILFRDIIAEGDEKRIYQLLSTAKEKRVSLDEKFEKVSNNDL